MVPCALHIDPCAMAGVSCSGVLLLLPRRPMVHIVIQSQDTLYEQKTLNGGQINEKEKILHILCILHL